MSCDVTSKEDWKNAWNEAEDALGGKIDILCNNAGVPPSVSVAKSMFELEQPKNAKPTRSGPNRPAAAIGEGDFLGLMQLSENIQNPDVLTKLCFWPFWPFGPLKVNSDQIFEIYVLRWLCGPIFRGQIGCLGLLFELRQKKEKKRTNTRPARLRRR